MIGAVGLRTHVWNNRLKSLLLLAGFPFLLLLICFAIALVISALAAPSVGEGIEAAFRMVPGLLPFAAAAALIWFAIAWFANQAIIDRVTQARRITRADDPRLWNLLENLCISRGLTMPALRLIDSDARNAFASGIREGRYSVTVTRGLVEALDDAELEGVLAHELTHIRNRDVQLLVVAAVFVGILSLVGDLLVGGSRAPVGATRSITFTGRGLGSFAGRRGGGKGSGAAAIILIVIAIVIFLGVRLLAGGLRFALSRKREFMADAGAVELTKNPDAMITALGKIAVKSDLPAPAHVRAMFIDNPHARGLTGFFTTHPPIEARIDALVRYAGGRAPEPVAVAPAAATEAPPEEAPAAAYDPRTIWTTPWTTAPKPESPPDAPPAPGPRIL